MPTVIQIMLLRLKLKFYDLRYHVCLLYASGRPLFLIERWTIIPRRDSCSRSMHNCCLRGTKNVSRLSLNHEPNPCMLLLLLPLVTETFPFTDLATTINLNVHEKVC